MNFEKLEHFLMIKLNKKDTLKDDFKQVIKIKD